MCFGNSQTKQETTTPIVNPAVQSAATQSLSQAQNLASQPYQAYQGPRVAPLSPLQQTGFDLTSQLTGAQAPSPDIASMYSNYANAPAPQVGVDPIYAHMGPYMNQYIQQALAPQLEAQNQQFAQQNKALNAAATGSGAFGDARTGIEAANLTNQQNIGRTGLIGQAYNNAFNTAIGAGAQDVSNLLGAGTTNANLYNTGLQRQLAGGAALQGFYPQLIQQALGAGGLQQQQAQAGLNVPYSNYLAAQQWPFLTQQNLNQTLQAGTAALPAGQQSTTTQPNNSGWSLLGALAPSLFAGGNQGFGGSAIGSAISGVGGMLAPLMMFSDERLKEDIDPVGKLYDGTNVYAFRYKGSPVKQIGVIAQEVEEDYPEFVHEIAGYKAVDYDSLTKLAGIVGMAA